MDIIKRSKLMFEIIPKSKFTLQDVIDYNILIQTVPDNGTMIEIGSYLGTSICSISYFIKLKNIKVFCIDNNHLKGNEVFKKNIKLFKLDNYINFLNIDGNESINFFDDKSIDLIYLDFNFKFKLLNNWFNKLKTDNSFLCGQSFNRKKNDLYRLYGKNVKIVSKNSNTWYITKNMLKD